jgi:protein-tyrosine phosphatase
MIGIREANRPVKCVTEERAGCSTYHPKQHVSPYFTSEAEGVALDVVDIHSHILPGLDDGAKTLEDAVAMIKIAAESGTTDIVATPHANLEFKFNPELIDEKIAELQAQAGPVPRIHRGCDFHLTIENIEDALAHPFKYTINHKSYLLVEFSDSFIPDTSLAIFSRFQGAGMIPVITHPERNVHLRKRMDQLRSWVENGCLIQITAKSLLGGFGDTAKRISGELFDRNLVHFVASDAHDTKHRPPNLQAAYAYIAKNWGEERAEAVCVTTPLAALAGDAFQPVHRERPRKKKWFLFA